MINPLARATRGRIRVGTLKGTLVLAVAGLLYFAGSTIPPTITPPTIEAGLGYTGSQLVKIYNKDTYKKLTKKEKEKLDQLLREDEEIMSMIQIFLKCQG